MKTGKIFYAFCAIFVLGWMVVQTSAPKHLVLFSFISFSLAWAVYRLPTRSTNETLSSFFIYKREMPKREFIGTLVTTNIGFFSSVAFSCYLIAAMGIGPALLLVIAWIAGLLWFAYYIPQLLPFLRQGSTLHEYIAVSYGETADQKRKLRLYSSAITFLLYLASVGAEIKFTADVFSGPTEMGAFSLTLLLSVAGVLYVSISGYRGVVSTDRVRFWAIILGVGAIYYFIGHCLSVGPQLNFPSEFFGWRMLSIGADAKTLASLVVLMACYQFCVMDMWERCIAVVQSHDFNVDGAAPGAEAEKTSRVIGGMRRMIAWSIVPFLVLFGAWYGIGLLALGQNWVTDPEPAHIISSLLERLRHFAEISPKGAIAETLVVLCFTAAALSTIDGFIIAAVQTIVCDWFPSFTNSKKEWNALEPAEDALWLKWSRVLVVVVGVLAVGIAYLSFEVMNFWVGMYSLMLSFFPAVFCKVAVPNFRRPSAQVVASIVAGAAIALGAAILGTFIFKEAVYLTALPPFLALSVSGIILLPPTIRVKNTIVLVVGSILAAIIWQVRP